MGRQHARSRRGPLRRRLAAEILEPRQLLSITVNTLTDEFDASISDGDVSIRDALLAATPFETIQFAPELFAGGPATLPLTRGELRITKDVTIVGPGSDLLTISAASNDATPGLFDGRGSRIFNISNGGPAYIDVQIRGLTLSGGDAAGGGGAINSQENLTLVNVATTGNFSRGSGGGIASGGLLTLLGSVVYGNSTQGSGGGIDVAGPALAIYDSTIEGNTAGSDGGGLAVRDAAAEWVLENSAVRSNFAPRGGGVYTSAASAQLKNPDLSFNTSSEGAGLYSDGGDVQVLGGAVRFNQNNQSNARGGGLAVIDGNLTLSTVTIESNFATQGGGVYVEGGDLAITASTLSSNQASSGAGLYISQGNLTVDSSTISNNFAQSSGGGVRVNIGPAHSAFFRHSTIATNFANLGGGVAVDLDGSASLEHTIVAANNGAATAPDVIGQFAVRFSLIGNNSGASLSDFGGNLVGTAAAPINPLLGGLQINGGPTATHALLAGSPAIDAGDSFISPGNGAPLFDQRGDGFSRVLNGDGLEFAKIDLGAYELAPGSLSGAVWSDLNSDGLRNPHETGVSNWTVYIDENNNHAFDATSVTIDPDDFPTNTPLNSVSSHATISYSSFPGGAVFAQSFAASTGTLSFGTFDLFSQLRINFAAPTNRVSIDAVGVDGFDLGRLDAFDAAGNFLQSYSTTVLNASQSETMVIARPEADIAFVLAYGNDFQVVGLDNLQFDARERSTVTDAQGNYTFADVAPGQYTIGQVRQAGWNLTYPSAGLSATLNNLNNNGFAIANLVPTRFDFDEGFTGSAIVDGGGDMYDTGNILRTNRATSIAYTDGVLANGDSAFGPGSKYFTAKFPGLFMMGAQGISISTFGISGNLGANGAGGANADRFLVTVDGRQFTVFLKRVFGAGDPSVNHLIMVPGDGAGIARTFATNTDLDAHTLTGLTGIDEIYYAVVARQAGALLDTADAGQIARAILSNLGDNEAFYQVSVDPGVDLVNLDFGNFPLPGSIAGSKWSDVNGNGEREEDEPGLPGWTVFLDQNGDGVRQLSSTTTVSPTDVPRPVGAPNTPLTSSTVNVTGVGVIQDLNVRLHIDHTWDSDLAVNLVSPSGRRVQLFAGVGGSGNNFVDTLLDDEASTSINGGLPPFSAAYRPMGSLSDFDGESADGAWTLEVLDVSDDGDRGTLQDWSLVFNVLGEQFAVTDANGQYRFENLTYGQYIVTEESQPGWQVTAPLDLGVDPTDLAAQSAAIAALVPNRYDFSEGESGSFIDDGGDDMYDGGNILNTNLASGIPYTNGEVFDGTNAFGPGSEYFTAKYPGLFVLGASGVSIDAFRITGNNGADGGGTVNGNTIHITVNGKPFTVYLKRVYNAGDPSVNHLIVVPGDGAGIFRTFSTNTDDDFHEVTGLAGVSRIYYALVASANGGFLPPLTARDIAVAVVSAIGTGEAKTSATVNLAAGQAITGVDFGNHFTAPTLGDFTSDAIVEGWDFLLWQRQLGSNITPGTGADGDGNGIVDRADLALWQTNYLAVTSAAAVSSLAAASAPAALAEADEPDGHTFARNADAVFSSGDFTSLFNATTSSTFRPRFRPRPRL